METSDNDHPIRAKVGDTLHKQLLRMRPVIAAAIQLGCVEFDSVSRQSIEQTLAATPRLPSLDPVEGSRIAGENCEVCDDGTKTIFDSLFVVKHGKRFLRVNIEAQTTTPKGFPLRQNYYIARGVSSEKSHGVFKGSEYYKLQKFYSIWLMTDPAKEMENRVELDYRQVL